MALPALGIFWGERTIKVNIAAAKEKLAYEGGKSYDAGVWKDHVINSQKAGVGGMYGLLGIQYQLMKSTYEVGIQGRLVGATPEQGCDVGKCLAYCSGSCESQCDELEKTDEAYLEEIGWTKDMCDVPGSQEMIKAKCTDIKAKFEGCDASCDAAAGEQYLWPILALALGTAASSI